ncbi:MAG: hypothetical protein JWR84_1338 [Caulobacter sp.]|nr:hypothetical protein [Caulobacter sp.]
MSDRKHLCAGAGLAALVLFTAMTTHAQGAVTPKAVLDAAPALSAQESVSPLSALSVESSQEGTTASFKVGAQWNVIGQTEGSFISGSVTLSAPIDEKRGFAAPLTQDGLGGATSVKVQLSRLVVPAADTVAVDNSAVCRQDIQARFEQQNPGETAEPCDSGLAYSVGGTDLANRFDEAIAAVDPTICADMKAAFEQQNPGKKAARCDGDLSSKIEKPDLMARYKAAVQIVKTQPICGDIKAGFRKQNPDVGYPGCSAKLAFQVGGVALADRYDRALDMAFAKRRLTYYGVTGKVGNQSYTFYDPVTLAKTEVERTPWRAGVFYAWIGGAQTWTVIAEYAHEESFKEGESKTACLAGPGPVLPCVTGSLDPVRKVSKDIFSLEGRWTPGVLDFAKAKVGVAPKVAYDASNDNWAVALPVYLFGDKTGLTGGVRADWDSRSNDVIVGLFVTKAFSIPAGP